LPLSPEEIKRIMELRLKQAKAENPFFRASIDGVESDPEEGGERDTTDPNFIIEEEKLKRSSLIEDALSSMRVGD